MKITFAESAKADIIAFLVDEDGDLPEAAAALNETTGGLLSEAMDGSRFSGKKDQQAFIVECVYSGVTVLGTEIIANPQLLEAALVVETPRMLFPFARQVVQLCRITLFKLSDV